ncbi:MAG TPA: RNA polymerase sigma factor [Pyrinomonadaceae bacterium]|nr:RNA polymerase sigma factor [Pyrinomonadaceae bacterium]
MKVLLRRLSAGDSTAFWCLWEMHRDYLYGVCFNKMGGVREDAEDALSSAMMKAWDNLPRYAEAIINLRAWLTRLTCNLCIDMHRERNRQARVVISIEKINMDELSLTCTLESPEQAFFYRELCMHVRWRVQELPYPLRTAFILRFVHEMPYREIAERLILSTDNVRKRVQLARAILCTQLKGIFRD